MNLLMKDFVLEAVEYSEAGDVHVKARWVRKGMLLGDAPSNDEFPADLHELLEVMRTGEVVRRIDLSNLTLTLISREVAANMVTMEFSGRLVKKIHLSEEQVASIARRVGMTPATVLRQSPETIRAWMASLDMKEEG